MVAASFMPTGEEGSPKMAIGGNFPRKGLVISSFVLQDNQGTEIDADTLIQGCVSPLLEK